MYGFLKSIVSEFGWTFNGTKFGKKCWKAYEWLREKELRHIDRRGYK